MHTCRLSTIELSRNCFRIKSDSLLGSTICESEHESFEQVLKAIMGEIEFSNMLLNLVADKLS